MNLNESINSRLGFSFYALDLKQVSQKLIFNFNKAEAIIFSINDLTGNKIEKIRANIDVLGKIMGHKNISFHFPMNDCDYVNDTNIFNYLKLCIEMCDDLGLKILTIHPNIKYLLNEWYGKDVDYLKCKLFDKLYLATESSKELILCLENMPPIGNKCDDADALILFDSDVKNKSTDKLKFTWDICHYFNVVETMAKSKIDSTFRKVLPRYKECFHMDYLNIIDEIHHWHLSAFDMIANPLTKQFCNEGIIPNDYHYIEGFKSILTKSKGNIILEIKEDDYINRTNIYLMKKWCFNIT